MPRGDGRGVAADNQSRRDPMGDDESGGTRLRYTFALPRQGLKVISFQFMSLSY